MFRRSKSRSKVSDATVLVAGATGYLGSHAVRELASRGYTVKSLCRSTSNSSDLAEHSDIVIGDVTKPETLKQQLEGVDFVICCLGSPMLKDCSVLNALAAPKMEDPTIVQRDGVVNVFQEALAAGVKRFVMVSVFNGENTKKTIAAARAKEQAVDYIVKTSESSNIEYTIVRPTAFFKDMEEMFDRVVKTGKFTVIGSGDALVNPISGKDLAVRLCDCLTSEEDKNAAFGIGGPEAFRIKEIGEMIFEALGKEPQYSYVMPALLCSVGCMLGALSIFATKLLRYSEAITFIHYVCTSNNVADLYGKDNLKEFFEELAKEHTTEQAKEQSTEQSTEQATEQTGEATSTSNKEE